MSRAAVMAVALAVTVMVTTACGSKGTTHNVATGSSTSVTALGTRPASPPCSTGQLTITLHGVAGLGHSGEILGFHNHGGGPCVLVGYPGVDGVNRRGRAVVSARQTPRGYLGGLGQGVREKPVTLAPGQTASAILEGPSAPTSPACRHYNALAITPPNETRSFHAVAGAVICDPQIHPVVPGATGSEL